MIKALSYSESEIVDAVRAHAAKQTGARPDQLNVQIASPEHEELQFIVSRNDGSDCTMIDEVARWDAAQPITADTPVEVRRRKALEVLRLTNPGVQAVMERCKRMGIPHDTTFEILVIWLGEELAMFKDSLVDLAERTGESPRFRAYPKPMIE